MTYRKKLIEVALPLVAINTAAAREKSIRHGHPSTLHQWWARRPLAACRAVLFASLVDDPSEHPEEFPTEHDQEGERERLFRLIEQLVQWKNSNSEEILRQARTEIYKSTGGNLPPVLDPFAGGGSIPLEAQRLGLEAHASDLNPVAVLINKALIEIPPKFAGRPPVNLEARQSLLGSNWPGARGLADDIRYYGKWMCKEAERRLGHLYPKVFLPKEQGGGEATVIAWLWTHTVTCPNPACGIQMPLVRSFYLSQKKDKEVWADPEVDYLTAPPTIRFTVVTGKGRPKEGTINRQGGHCIVCGTPAPFDYIRSEGMASRMASQLMAIVTEGNSGRLYLASTEEHTIIATDAKPVWKPEAVLPDNTRDIRPQLYGLPTYGDLFTSRQLVMLTTFNDLVQEAREQILSDARSAGLPENGTSLNDEGLGDSAYADAVATYLAESVSKLTMFHNVLAFWRSKENKSATGLGRQALPMVWDFAEINPFAGAGGDFLEIVTKTIPKVLSQSVPATPQGFVRHLNAEEKINYLFQPIISTDPPYYDNISYADLSDFYYVWLRISLKKIYPDLFSTLLTPKAQELVAMPYRFNGNKDQAQSFFETGLHQAFSRMREVQHPDYPLTVYYAFKQTESEIDDEDHDSEDIASVAIASTGWESMLEGLIQAGFTITGTWPMRTEMSSRMIGKGTNALASSIVLVCRPRAVDAPIASRREFLNSLRTELPAKLKKLQQSSIAPVDLAQASIGPGMSIYSRYSKVVESDGKPMAVRTALQLINRALDEALAEQEGEYDGETRWAIAWFEQYAMNIAEYGVAETLSKAKNTTVQSLVDAGLLEARSGKVRLLKREEFPQEWKLKDKSHLTAWEVMQRMIHALLSGSGESGAGDILRQVSEQAEMARDLAYRLYTVCERKNWAQEALAYNSLVTSWSEISRLAHREAEEIRQASFLG